MKKRFVWLSVLVLALFFSALACSFNFSSAKVENLRTAKDEDGNQATTQFSPTDPFYLVGELKNAPEDTQLKVVWTAVSVEGADPNTMIQEYEQTGGSGPFWFNLTSNSGVWLPGQYKVDFYLNGELNASIEFEVVEG